MLPNATRVMQSPPIRGALRALLGDGYLMHAHRHMHTSRKATDQVWHKDSYWGTRKLRHHRSRWVMALYYPKRVTLAMAPTYVLPHSHYATIDTGEVAHAGEDRLGRARFAADAEHTHYYTDGDAEGRRCRLDAE